MSESPNEQVVPPGEAPQASAEPPKPAPEPKSVAAEQPSIVVDDPAMAAAATTSEIALNARTDIPVAVEVAQPWAEAPPLTSADAERFASGFRASWDVEEAAPSTSPSVPPPGFTARPRSATPSASHMSQLDHPVELPMQRTTRSPAFWGAIAVVVGILVIVGALISSGGSHETTVAQTGTQPAVPTLGAAPETTPTPAAPSLPVPTTSPFAPVAPPVVVAPVPPPVVVPPVVAPVPPPVVVAPVPPPVVVPPVPPPVVVPPPPPRVAAAPTPPPPPPTNHLRAHTVPATARLMVDGQSVANPYDGTLLRGHTYQLSAIATGFDPAMESVTLTRDQSVTLTLHPVPAPPPAVAHHTAPPVHHHAPPAHHAPPPAHHNPPPAHHGHGSFVSDNPFD